MKLLFSGEGDFRGKLHRHTIAAASSGRPPLQHLQDTRKSPKVVQHQPKNRTPKRGAKGPPVQERPCKSKLLAEDFTQRWGERERNDKDIERMH